ncbi:MAG: MFS transporter [Clostridia bacterium]|nr:MFS transporter [Clostridia bacterium]
MKLGYKHTLYACFIGYITQAVVNNFAPLLFIIFHSQLSVPLEQITLLVTINFLVQLFVDFISPFFVDKIGYKTSIIIAHVFSAAGLALLGILPLVFPSPFPALLIAVIVYAVGGGIIEVLISPIAESCPTKNKSATMSLLHSFYCWGTMGVVIISTLFLAYFGKGSWHVLAVLWSLVPVFNVLYFSLVPVNHLLTEEDTAMSPKELFSSKTFALFILLMISAGASEQAMSQWASFFVESALGVPKALGDILGICLFALMMGIARVTYSKASDKLNLRLCLIASGILSIASYITVAISPYSALSLIACALCGLSAGILWPGVFSMAAEHFPRGGTLMFALLALAGDLGCSSGPTLTGFVSSAFSDNLNLGLLAAAVFPLILIISAALLKKSQS